MAINKWLLTKTICMAVVELAEGRTDGKGISFCREVAAGALPDPSQPRDPFPTSKVPKDIQPVTNKLIDYGPEPPPEKDAPAPGSKAWFARQREKAKQ